MFIAVNARIDDQFEFIQRLWLNDGDRQRLGASRDVVAGSSRSESTIVVQFDGRPVVTTANPRFVQTMGGEYFFAPSMAGLRALADGRSTARWVTEELQHLIGIDRPARTPALDQLDETPLAAERDEHRAQRLVGIVEIFTEHGAPSACAACSANSPSVSTYSNPAQCRHTARTSSGMVRWSDRKNRLAAGRAGPRPSKSALNSR